MTMHSKLLQKPDVNLDDLFPIPIAIDLLKCDIEGAEQIFLNHYPGLMQRVQSAVFELHSNYCDAKKCIELIQAAGLIREVLAEQRIDLDTGDYLELWPHKHGTDGFFAAVLERLPVAAKEVVVEEPVEE